MRAEGWGRIVNLASNSISMQVPGVTHYVASKMAVIGLTRGTATEFAPFGITANAIAPSAVRTPGAADMPGEAVAAISLRCSRSSAPACPRTSPAPWRSSFPTTPQF